MFLIEHRHKEHRIDCDKFFTRRRKTSYAKPKDLTLTINAFLTISRVISVVTEPEKSYNFSLTSVVYVWWMIVIYFFLGVLSNTKLFSEKKEKDLSFRRIMAKILLSLNSIHNIDGV